MIYLQKGYALCDLFDKVEALPCFWGQEDSISIDLDNITFGP
jgi:hypothetical protein